MVGGSIYWLNISAGLFGNMFKYFELGTSLDTFCLRNFVLRKATKQRQIPFPFEGKKKNLMSSKNWSQSLYTTGKYNTIQSFNLMRYIYWHGTIYNIYNYCKRIKVEECITKIVSIVPVIIENQTQLHRLTKPLWLAGFFFFCYFSHRLFIMFIYFDANWLDIFISCPGWLKTVYRDLFLKAIR